MNKKKKIVLPIVLLSAILLVLCAFLIFTGTYYHADSVALAALNPDKEVTVSKADYGYFFDGPSEDTALILYPGAKVEAAAYAPLCRDLANSGVDVCLVDMPFKIAFLGINKADKIIDSANYEHWYIAGHSLGGVAASRYASEHADKLDGVVLLASFTVHELDESLNTILIYGSEDKVLDMNKYHDNSGNLPPNAKEYVLDGGNHAGFGSYGPQKGDGEATISQDEQVSETAEFIINKIREQ
ncbi:MAG: hypothetical protein J5626_01810 [Lachnospiraceae bacterium]|nr:hypothetical protein [Lachnospiraceae bacterium]